MKRRRENGEMQNEMVERWHEQCEKMEADFPSHF